MTQHYTRNTVSVDKWCNKCHTFTSHQVSDGRVTNNCLPCSEKAEEIRRSTPVRPKPEVQVSLFAEVVS